MRFFFFWMGAALGEPTRAYVMVTSGCAEVALAVENFFLDEDFDSFGGNILATATLELLFPLPFIKDRSKLRSAFFIDAGNVFNTKCASSQINCFDVDADELRYSVGVGVTWITGFGPMTFSLAKPLNASDEDEEEAFQFTLGRGF